MKTQIFFLIIIIHQAISCELGNEKCYCHIYNQNKLNCDEASTVESILDLVKLRVDPLVVFNSLNIDLSILNKVFSSINILKSNLTQLITILSLTNNKIKVMLCRML